MALLKALRPTLPVLIGASVMLTLSMGQRQSLGIFLQPLGVTGAGIIQIAFALIRPASPPLLKAA